MLELPTSNRKLNFAKIRQIAPLHIIIITVVLQIHIVSLGVFVIRRFAPCPHSWKKNKAWISFLDSRLSTLWHHYMWSMPSAEWGIWVCIPQRIHRFVHRTTKLLSNNVLRKFTSTICATCFLILTCISMNKRRHHFCGYLDSALLRIPMIFVHTFFLLTARQPQIMNLYPVAEILLVSRQMGTTQSGLKTLIDWLSGN